MRAITTGLLSLCLLAACGIPKMRDTNATSSASTYDSLEAKAKAKGWTTERSPDGVAKSDGMKYWILKVHPTAEETIYYTKNNATGGVSFTCGGGSLDDGDKCNEVAMGLVNDPEPAPAATPAPVETAPATDAPAATP
jgi:hypothetical protein